MNDAYLKRLALLMTVNCVRNTVVEDYHADGKLNDVEMTAFNQEVADKIYTFLEFMLVKSDEDRDAFLSAMGAMYTSHWDQPKLDPDFLEAVKVVKRLARLSNRTGDDKV